MAKRTKRSTIYLDSDLHRALRIKSADTGRSMSDLVNEAVKNALDEDLIDLKAFKERKDERLFSFEEALEKLKKNGKI